MGRERAPILRFLVFAVFCLSLAWVLVITLGNITPFADRVQYAAEMDDATGLIVNDNVKVAGVTVGKVTDIVVADGGHARVIFSVDREVDVPEDSRIEVRWRDTFGLRFLYVEPGEGDALPKDGGLDGDGCDAQVRCFGLDQTDAPTDLGVFLKRITPFVQELDADLTNVVTEALAESIIGREDQIREIISDGADLTEALASRDEELGRLLSNSSQLLDAYSDRDEDLRALLDSFVDVTSTLAQRNDVFDRALGSLADVQTEVGDLVETNEDELRLILDDLDVVAAVLRDNRDRLERTIELSGQGLAVYHRVSRLGQWFNVRGVGNSLDYETLDSERGAELPPPDPEAQSQTSSSTGAISVFEAPLRAGRTEGGR